MKILISIFYITIVWPYMALGQNIDRVQDTSMSVSNSSDRLKSGIDTESVVLQKHDYSCGAAALATLLTYYYGITVSEDEILEATHKSGWLSLADIQQVLPSYGMKGIGLALNYDQLTNLKIPVIVYTENPEGPHFAVLRGLSNNKVWLADSTQGNIKYTLEKFRKKWEVRADSEHQGKILAVIPLGEMPKTVNPKFFHNEISH